MVADIDTAIRAAGRRAIDHDPRLEPPLSAARTAYVKTILDAVAWRHRRRHAAAIDPYELLWVDPHDIEHVATEFEAPKFRRLGRVAGGDWDEPDIRFTETDVFQGLEAHFEHGVPWQQTGFFQRVAAEIELGRRPWGCDSRGALETRCQRLEALYDRIDREGYLSQPELIDADGSDADAASSDPAGRRRSSRIGRLIKDEIAVDIGRDGRLLFADGRNRLAIAQLLDVERIPVLVLVRHDRWQGVRDLVASWGRTTGRWPSAADLHPDLHRLVPEVGRDPDADTPEHGASTDTEPAPESRRPRSIRPWC